MPEESAKLRIPYVAAAQAQKHVTHNEAMTLLDTLVQLSVLDKDLTAPPGSPDEGDCYIVAGAGGIATGAWAGWEKRIARFIDGEWRSYLPGEGVGAGWLAWVLDEDAMYRFDGAAWALAGIEGPPGIAIAPDAVVNELADRDAYDEEAAGFAVLVVSDASNDGLTTLYYKLSASSADWSDPVPWPAAAGGPEPVVLRGHLWGLTLTNNTTDANNDIDIAVGEAADDTSTDANRVVMRLASARTKRLDAAWAVGSGNGGRDTGSIANGTWHVWLIQRSDTGVVDALFSQSATAPTMPSNYDRKRRIGSIIRSGGAILGFLQTGDVFTLNSPVTDRSSTSGAASALLALTVPSGIVVRPIQHWRIQAAASNQTNLAGGDAASGSAGVQVVIQFDATWGSVVMDGTFATNTSGQIYFSHTNTAGTPVSTTLQTLGWHDTRGRLR